MSALLDFLNSGSIGSLVAGNAGAGAESTFVSSGMLRQIMQDVFGSISISVKWFGAKGDGRTNDTAAIALASSVAASVGGSAFFPDGTYKVAGLTIVSPIFSNGGAIIAGTGVFMSVGANNVSIRNITVRGDSVSGTVADIGINCIDFDGLLIDDCTIKNCRILARNTQATTREFFRLSRCRIDCDFSFADYTVQQVDPVSTRGYKNVWVIDNRFVCTNTHRILKFTDTEATSPTDDISLYISERIIIRGNTFTGSTTSAKQVIDLYSGAFNTEISGNHFDVRGWAWIVNSKTHRQSLTKQSNIRFVNNTCTSDNQIIEMQGTYGNTADGGIWEKLEQNVSLVDNQIEYVGTSTANPIISCRFMHEVLVSNNQIINSGAVASLLGVAAYGNRTHATTDNKFKKCSIYHNHTTGDSQGDVHTVLAKQITVSGNQFEDFTASSHQGPIAFRDIVSSELIVTVSGNTMLQSSIAGAASGCVSVRDCTLRLLSVTGNVGTMQDPLHERLLLTGANTITRTVEAGNSWNRKGGGSVDRGDASVTVLVKSDDPNVLYKTALTATRTVTLSTTDARDGDVFYIERTAAATGAFRLLVGALATLMAGQWAIVQFDGTAWYLFASGDVSTDTQTSVTANTSTWVRGQASELLVLSTVAATTDTIANLLPANSIIEAVTARITAAIVTATDWALGDATTANRFTAANATKATGTTTIGLRHYQGSIATDATGPVQTAAAPVRVTTTGALPTAGTVRITVYYRTFTAPTT